MKQNVVIVQSLKNIPMKHVQKDQSWWQALKLKQYQDVLIIWLLNDLLIKQKIKMN